MALIGITREMGAYGTDIAAGVAKALGIPLVHHEIADRVASRWRIQKEVVLDPGTIAPTPYKGFRSAAVRNVAYVSLEILSIAAAGSAVFRGWGAAQLFYRLPHAVSVHIGAPFKVRVARMRERLNLEMNLVKRIVHDNDVIRARLSREYFGCNWADPNEYDVAINTARSSVDDAIEEILALAGRPGFQVTPKTNRILENMRLEKLAYATLYSSRATRDLRIHVKASGAELIVGGIVDDGDQREEVIHALSNMERGISVTYRLRAPTDYRVRTSSI